MRACLVVLLLMSVATQAADGEAVPYKGRAVADVIDEFRAAGYPFAYSSSLVGPGLTVEAEPEGDDPQEIVEQILKPHRLTIKEQGGLLLVVRFDAQGSETGHILLVVTSKDNERDRKSVV